MKRFLPSLLTAAAVIGAIGLAGSEPAPVNPPALELIWDYDPQPEDEGQVVAFNVWESLDCRVAIEDWQWVGMTTNHSFWVQPAPVDFFRVSSFYQL